MTFNKAAFEASILKRLTEVAKDFMEIMAQKVNQNNLPKAINEHTGAESPQKKGSTYSIDVVIDTSEDAAPMAGAYEWGSGVHRTKGTPGLYPIAAKDAPELVFWWEKRQKWFRGAALPFGHPGVEARPYIRPSIEKIQEPLKQKFAKEIKMQLLRGTPKVTIIDAKK